MALYIHIPYCEAKCHYCDFNSYAGREREFETYVEALCLDLRRSAQAVRERGTLPLPLRTVFIGGGTPSVLPGPLLARVLEVAREELGFAADIEITSEANPGSAQGPFIEAMLSAGLTRLSMGVQSMHDGELALLGRVHTREVAVAAVRTARACGVPNLSLDFIFGLPGQSVEAWRHNLAEAIALEPEHLSCYGLIIEEATAFGRSHAAGQLVVPDDDAQAEMYDATVAMTRAAGYEQYEISNYARNGLRCRHNEMYWRNGAYLGVGAGAVSYLDGWRFTRCLRPAEYIRRVQEDVSVVTEAERVSAGMRLAETLILGLRTRDGVDLRALPELPPGLLSALLADFLAGGLVVEERGWLRPTDAGVFVSSGIMERLLELPAHLAQEACASSLNSNQSFNSLHSLIFA